MTLTVAIGGGSDAAAWAQAWLSAAAILVSALMAIAAPLVLKAVERANDLRDRLTVSTGAERTSLFVHIDFRPVAPHVGYVARVTVHDPADAELVSGETVRSHAASNQYGWAYLGETLAATRTVTVPLNPHGTERKGSVIARVHGAASWSKKAILSITILTNSAQPRALVRSKIHVAPPY